MSKKDGILDESCSFLYTGKNRKESVFVLGRQQSFSEGIEREESRKKENDMKKKKSTGIVRGIDNLGRVVLPKELRTAMGLTGDSKVEIFAENGAIVMRKYIPPKACMFCGAVDERAVVFEGCCICPACCERIASLEPGQTTVEGSVAL